MKDKIRLICTENGHNKFYEIEDIGNGKVQISYGRIGASPVVMIKSKSYGDFKYNEKTSKKGYIDVSKSIAKFSLEEVFANLDKLEAKLTIYED